MSTLALNIQMNGKLVVIVGGGSVAYRKLRTLMKAGAVVRVIAMDICSGINAHKDSGALHIRIGSYMATDLDDAFMVIAATDDVMVNEQVRDDAQKRKILATIANNPLSGDCTFPAILQRGALDIAVSTGGRCPTFAADVRDCIAEHIGAEYGVILEQIVTEREKLLTNGNSTTYNAGVLRSLASRLIFELTNRKESLP